MLSPRQRRAAIITGVVLSCVIVGGVAVWLNANAEMTIQRRAAMTPNVTMMLPGHEAKVPASWENAAEKPTAAAMPETKTLPPEVKPEAAPPASETPSAQHQAQQPEATPPAVEVPNAATQPPSAPPATWQKNARAFDANDKRPRIALVVSDLGFSTPVTDAAIELPADVTLGFSSLASELGTWVQKAKTAGHEIVLGVPMEPDNYPQNDPGPDALLVGNSDQDNVAHLTRALAAATDYAAIMPAMGGKFVTAENKLVPVLTTIKDQGLMIVDGTNVKTSLLAPLARLNAIPAVRADIILDMSAGDAAMDQQLAQLEAVAKEKGQAVAIVTPYPAVFDKLKIWTAGLAQKNIVLAPVTATIITSPVAEAAPAAQPAPPAEEAK